MKIHASRPATTILGLGLLGGSLAACGTTSHSPTVANGSPGASATSTTLQCSYTPDSAPTGGRHPGLPPQPGPGPTTATFHTSAGTFVIKLNAAKAPCTTSSFRHLAEVGFFNNTHCQRLTTAGIFVLQCGDPTGTGTGGPGYTIPDENLTGATYPAGTVAMANTGAPHTGGSQFFIVYKNTTLAPSYTPFGTVTSGLSVIQRVAAGGSNNANGAGDGAPKIPVNISTVKMS